MDGLDLARQLPTVAGRVIRAKLRGAHLVVVGEREPPGGRARRPLPAHPARHRGRLYAAMAKVIADRGLHDREFLRARCRDGDAFLAAVREVDLLGAAAACGVEAGQIEEAALAYGEARAAAILYSTAVPRPARGRSRRWSAWRSSPATWAGPAAASSRWPSTTTCRASATWACSPTGCPATGRERRAPRGAPRWSAAGAARCPPRPGLSAADVFSAAEPAPVRALWLTRYDPVGTAAGPSAARVLEACELVVVQHVFRTETARYAHLILPTTAFGEEQVTFTSTERRVQLAAQAVPPPAGRRARLAAAGAGGAGAGRRLDLPSSAAEVMDEIAEVVPFYSGISHAALARDHGRQWPCTRETARRHPHALRGLADRARPFQLRSPPARPAEEPADPAYPLTLVFGHSDHYWNQNVLVQHSETLRREYRLLLLDYPEGFVELNPEDAKGLGDPRRRAGPGGLGGGRGRDRRPRHPRGASRGGVRAVLRAPGPGAGAARRPGGPGAPAGPRREGGERAMKARVLDSGDVLRVIDLLRIQGYQVMAPFAERGRRQRLRPGHRREPGRGRAPPRPTRSTRPSGSRSRPSSPCCEIRGHGNETTFRPTVEAPRVAVFGIRSCDVAGIGHLDRFYLGGEFRDIYYATRREELFLVNVVCTEPGRGHRRGLLLPLHRHRPGRARGLRPAAHGPGRGEWLALAGTPEGRGALRGARLPARHARARRAAPGHPGARSAPALQDLHQLVRGGGLAASRAGSVREGTWEEIGRRCLECGGCTYVCPACTCFTVSDRPVGPDRDRAGPHLGLLRALRLHPHGRRPQPAQGRARPPQPPLLPEAGALLHPARTLDGLRGLRPLRRGLPRRRGHAQRGGAAAGRGPTSCSRMDGRAAQRRTGVRNRRPTRTSTCPSWRCSTGSPTRSPR